MSDTPRTDADVYYTYSEGNQGMGEEYAEHVVAADFARELERELAVTWRERAEESAELAKAQAEVARMRQVLEFYANRENWKDVDTGIGTFPGDAVDYGNRAREAITKDEYPRVVSAAIMGYDNKPVSLPPPARHHDVIHHMVKELGHPKPIIGEQGFILSDGSFARRKRAMMFAKVNQQLIRNEGKMEELYSEDVW